MMVLEAGFSVDASLPPSIGDELRTFSLEVISDIRCRMVRQNIFVPSPTSVDNKNFSMILMAVAGQLLDKDKILASFSSSNS